MNEAIDLARKLLDQRDRVTTLYGKQLGESLAEQVLIESAGEPECSKPDNYFCVYAPKEKS